jgi:hypothetical protein
MSVKIRQKQLTYLKIFLDFPFFLEKKNRKRILKVLYLKMSIHLG